MIPSNGKAIMGNSDVMGRGRAFRNRMDTKWLKQQLSTCFLNFYVLYLGHPVDCHNDDNISSQSFLRGMIQFILMLMKLIMKYWNLSPD
jgi:hypothetical protein